MATQITLNKNKKINEIIVRGRPAKTFTNSMGDHTTAFIVQTEGLNVKLKDKTIKEAIDFIAGLGEHLKSLPGYDYIDSNKDSNISQRFNEDFKLLDFYIKSANKDHLEDDMKVNYLQSAINHYLSARELIPFSTINVGEKSKGKAGKGHGESSPAAVLSNYERGLSPTLEKEKLVEATYKLFDYQSAGMVSIEQNEDMIKSMTGDISFGEEKDPNKRLKLIWNQHKKSIEKMFPKVYAIVGSQLTDDKIEASIESLGKSDFDFFLEQAKSNLYQAKVKISAIVDSQNRQELTFPFIKAMATIYMRESDVLDNWKMLQKIDKIFPKKYSQQLEDLQKEIQEYNGEYKKVIEKIKACFKSEGKFKKLLDQKLQNAMTEAFKDKTEKDTEPEIGLGKRPNIENIITLITKRPLEIFTPTDVLMTDASSTTEEKKENRKSSRIERRKSAPPPEDGQKKPVKKVTGKRSIKSADKDKTKMDIETPKDDKKKDSEKSKSPKTLTSNLLPMSIQIILGERGKKSKDSNAMDTEEKEIFVTGMIAGGRPASPFQGTMGAHSTAWIVHLDRVRSYIINKTIKEAIEGIENLLKDVNKFAKKRGQDELVLGKEEDNFSLARLQNLINKILSFYNLIPGVTNEKIDTRGKGEGTYRKKLKNYELYGEGTKEDLQNAIKGLFDSRKRTGDLWDNHLKIISKAYPDSYSFVYEKAGKKIAKPMPTKVQPDEDLDDEDDNNSDLNEDEIRELTAKSIDDSWLYGVNNCLINAITDAAGIARATKEQVIAIRKEIGAAAGEMLFASTRILNIILRHLGLIDRGVIVINRGSNFLDYSSNVSDNPLYIYHNGIDHFASLPNPTPPEKKRASSEVSGGSPGPEEKKVKKDDKKGDK